MSDLATGRSLGQPPHYTKEGDQGTTALGGYGEVPKDDLRLVACGSCEEVNAGIGMAMAFGGFDTDETATLSSLQNDLYDLQADLGTPVPTDGTDETLRVQEAHVERLERACDYYSDSLRSTDGSVLPGGTVPAALLYQARTVARRAERDAWASVQQHQETVNPLAARYLNRLSALLFVLARHANTEHGDSIWRPGNSVSAESPDADSSASAESTGADSRGQSA